MSISKILLHLKYLTNHINPYQMKKIKLLLGLLLVAGFFAAIALTNTSNEDQAIRKDRIVIPRNG